MGGRLLRTLLFGALVPATFLVFIPAMILNVTGIESGDGVLRLVGLVPLVLGIAILAWCFAGFIVEGEGTPAPYDPPHRLVTGRLYGWMRNPMYVAVTTILLGEAMFYGSIPLLVWAAVAWIFFHFFVVLYEEPTLQRRFGPAYESYVEHVPRWLPSRPRIVVAKPPLKLATLVYALRDEQVLLLRRTTEPNRGLWVAPGGKFDHGESPTECAVREMYEETGLRIQQPVLRGVMTETSPRADYQWLTFIFVAWDFEGTFTPAPGIGEFRWVPVDEVAKLPIPPADAIFFPRLVEDGSTFHGKFEYDADLNLLRWQET
ncbi:MAG TPA: NUDIX domain-containing protein [Candidatus Limnocylindria bacterium]|nr:NUDIX domain-containing protein [Candidatus Limnocylindria bacterium]